MSDSNWKKFLLKSGLPFEYEVKECFVQKGCTVWDEYSYLRLDENKLEKEFSYDIDANYWVGNKSVDFMIECKYKTEPTKWVFTPDPYGYQKEINQNSFFHPVDYFTEGKFPFDKSPYFAIRNKLGDICLKGVEIYKNQFIETNIFKAINQLSYAFIGKIIASIDNQLNTDLFSESVMFNIPIIITNAELFIINKKATTKEIENATEIEDVATRNNFLFFHNKIGNQLRMYNRQKLKIFFNEIGEEKFMERNKSFANDINHFIDILSSEFSPQMIIVMHHDENHENYKKLFDYINFHLIQSKERDASMRKAEADWKKRFEKIKFSKD